MKTTNGILILAMLLISVSVQTKEYKIATISPDGLAWMKEFRGRSQTNRRGHRR